MRFMFFSSILLFSSLSWADPFLGKQIDRIGLPPFEESSLYQMAVCETNNTLRIEAIKATLEAPYQQSAYNRMIQLEQFFKNPRHIVRSIVQDSLVKNENTIIDRVNKFKESEREAIQKVRHGIAVKVVSTLCKRTYGVFKLLSSSACLPFNKPYVKGTDPTKPIQVAMGYCGLMIPLIAEAADLKEQAAQEQRRPAKQ